jgi:Short C-terminal domain
MPGLIRGVARTAVVAGTATAVSNRVSRRQANRWADQSEQQYYEQQGRNAEQQQQAYAQPAPAPAPAPAAPAVDPIAQLKELAELKSQGILTDAEFQAQKTKILNS